MNPVSTSWWQVPAHWAYIASLVVAAGNAIVPLVPADVSGLLATILTIIGLVAGTKTLNTALGATH